MSPLPLELIHEIISHCTNGSLARCALANKVLLDLSRSHLYHHIVWDFPWRHPNMIHTIATYPCLLSHTRHLTIDIFNSKFSMVYNGLSRLVTDLLELEKLETLTLKPSWSSNPEQCLRFQALLFKLVPMSSLIGISLFLDVETDSPGLIPFLSSPKLRDLSVVLDPWYKDGEGPTSDFVILNPSLKFLFHSPQRLDLSNIRRLAIGFVWAEVVTVYIVKLLTACSSLTHLVLGFEGLSFDEEDIPTLFIPIQRLLSLTSLTIKTDINMTTIDKLLDQFHLIFQQLHPKAPMRCVILDIHWTSASPPTMIIESHPTCEVLCSILKSRDERPCQLVIKV